MKRYRSKTITALSIAGLALLFSGPATAHGGHHGDRLGDRITMTWTVDGMSKVFDVRAPVNPPLRYVKRHFMAKAGLPERAARDFVVEKVVTIVPARNPSILLPPGAIPRPVTVTPVTQYIQLDESQSLQALGVVDGDTLRVRRVATTTAANDEGLAQRDADHFGHHH